ncbi:MAG: hypothetical protein KDK97_01175 [Verrucomicrobiales bacterium]|nr:hypothetical protein [Verrucomicrobiales bacterium]MCP5559181.1 hypothetical protein [Verrucomicrobiaceae bacterium]
MTSFRIFRIVLMILGIFAAGIATGRYAAPPPVVVSSKMEFSASDGRIITPRFIVACFDRKLQLAPAQKKGLIREAATFIEEVATTPPGTQQRFDVFLRYYPKVRALLRADQYSAFDALVETHKQRMAEILKEGAESKQ